jgi:hypothetical protein
MEAIGDYFRCRDESAALDDRTWNDLLLDDVFAHVDRTESSVGQQVLYDRLRAAPRPRHLPSFEALVCRFSDNRERREQAQLALSRLRDSSAYYLHRLARPGALVRQPWHVCFPLWAGAVVCTVAAGIVWHGLLFLLIPVAVINLGIRTATGRRIGSEIVWFRQVGPLLGAAKVLTILHEDHVAPLTQALHDDLPTLRRLGAIAQWVSRDPVRAGELLGAFLEYLNLLFLLDANALYFAGLELERRAAPLLRVLESVGEIDAAIAVASVRAGASGWTHPEFVASGAPAAFTGLRHPLVDDAIPNSITLAPPHGALVTGSNMSGKSTWLRTVGVNVVLAQAIHTCLADVYAAPIYHPRSCIGRADDLLAGKSYYLVEVESVLALVKASERPEPHLFIFDELFRGTNAVERIAAAEAVLRTLIGNGRRHVVLAATHDGELVELLREVYAVYHLGDAVGPNGLIFDYHLTPGPATSRNAIALLRLSGAPEPLVRQAIERAALLDHQRQQSH